MKPTSLLIALILCTASSARAETLGKDWFWDHELTNCHAYKFKSGYFMVCVNSLPAGEKKRTFEIVVTDPSKLDPKTKDHVLVTKTQVAVKDGEYVDYEAAGIYNVADDEAVIFLSVVQGTPSDWQEGRAVIYQFSAGTKKLAQAWESGLCGANCRHQDMSMRHKKGETTWDLIVTQKGDETRTTELFFDGKKLKPKK